MAQPVEVEHLLQRNYTWLGPEAPMDFDHLAESHNCLCLVKPLPIGDHFQGLLWEYNNRHDELRSVTPKDVVEFTNQERVQGFLWLQAIRNYGSPRYKLIGQEDKYIGYPLYDLNLIDNPHAISLAIAIKGLTVETNQPELTASLLDHKLSGLRLKELEEVHRELRGIQSIDLTPAATEWRKQNREIADRLPDPLKKIYYLRGTKGDIKEIYAVLKLSRHPALGQPNWDEMETIAHNAGLLYTVAGSQREYTVADLTRGRLIVKLYSETSIPLLGYVLRTANPTPP